MERKCQNELLSSFFDKTGEIGKLYKHGFIKKSRRDFISVLLYFSGPLGSMTPIHLVLRIEHRSSRCKGA